MLFIGLDGESDDRGRDLEIDALRAAAAHLSTEYQRETKAVRWEEDGWVSEGFMVRQVNPSSRPGTRILAVRRRRSRLRGRWLGGWQQLQTVPEAASELGTWMRAHDQSGPG